jgi:hypothetical protein
MPTCSEKLDVVRDGIRLVAPCLRLTDRHSHACHCGAVTHPHGAWPALLPACHERGGMPWLEEAASASRQGTDANVSLNSLP